MPRKGEITLKLLSILAETALSAADAISVILNSRYGDSLSRMQRNLSRKEMMRKANPNARQSYYSLLSRLKGDGFLAEERGSCRRLTLTSKGRRYMKLLRRNISKIPLKKDYVGEKSKSLVIVAFDVPEKERNKREWLRRVLRELGLQMIQRSVWFGRIKIPKELIEDLGFLGMVDYVEIFEVGKAGSLRHLI